MSTRARKILGRSSISLAIVAAMMPAIHSCVFDETRTQLCPSGRRCPTGWTCAAAQDICISDGCGNGILERSIGEVCDDGNIHDNDSCTTDCSALAGCGNGRLDSGETCDDKNHASGDGCSGDCLSKEVCGNGYLDVGEVCDDGNRDGGDGCSADCKVLERCGDGEQQVGEACDDGNRSSGDGCSEDCLSNEICGNGYRDQDEACDMGLQDTATCNANCEVAECGDGYPNDKFMNPDTGKPEECDDGLNTRYCNLNCTIAECGDGFFNDKTVVDVDPNEPGHLEECDDGNDDDNDACVKDCVKAICGDGFVWKGREKCDEGDDNSDEPNQGCRENCKLRKCGDGIVDDEFGESCDDGDQDNSDGCPDGPGGTCAWATCGDGFLADSELCDPAANPTGCSMGQTCIGKFLPGECTCQTPTMPMASLLPRHPR